MGRWDYDHFNMPSGGRGRGGTNGQPKGLRCACGQPKLIYQACCVKCAEVQKRIAQSEDEKSSAVRSR